MSGANTKRKPNTLFVPHFGGLDELPYPGDSTATAMVVNVDRISFFDKNPRRSPNDKYEEIKESIRESGLDNPLPISRRPTDPVGEYFIYKGGNTRLRVLKELWSETGDQRFFNVDCRFTPFVSELDALISHQKENELRGGMTFIDRALSMQVIKEWIEAELGESLSLRKLESVLKERGIPTSAADISRFEYAAKLHSVLPKALEAGMGEPQIRKLRKLEKAALDVWRFHSEVEGAEQQFRDVVFLPALTRSDTDKWSYESTEALVKETLARTLPQAITADAIMLSFKHAIDGKALHGTPEVEVNTPTSPIPPYSDSMDQESLAPTYAPLDQYDLLNNNSFPNHESIQNLQATSSEPNTKRAWQPMNDIYLDSQVNAKVSSDEVILEGSVRWLDKLRQLRERSYEIATVLADNCPIPKARQAISKIDTGYGFILNDAFNPDFILQLVKKIKGETPCSEEGRVTAGRDYKQAANLWWFMAEACGLFHDKEESWINAPDSLLTEYIDAESCLRNQKLLYLLHPVTDSSEHLRTFWLAMSGQESLLAYQLIRNTVSIIELVSNHREQTNNAYPWEVITRGY
jgi:ParB family protein of integrating conjugative element (PFGI_1 class)